MEDLVRYLDEIVEPTIADFERSPTSVRHAFLACVVVFHSVDYLSFPKTSRSLRQQFHNESPEFALVDRVAHAFKHVVSGNPHGRHLAAAGVISRPPGIWGEAIGGLSRWNDSSGGVTLDTNRSVDLLEAVKAVAAFLRKKVE